MPYPALRVRPFSADLLPEVQGFHCGDQPWQQEVADWLKDATGNDCAVRWIERGTQVWLYFTVDGALVGYGSLGTTTWRWPPPDGPKETVSIIPSFAVQTPYQGQPRDAPPEGRYACQIIADLIARAKEQGTRILGLFVDRRNARATAFYRRIGFQPLPDEGRPYLRMFLDLR
jgi:GNAT superfamily N-acetyltransferase